MPFAAKAPSVPASTLTGLCLRCAACLRSDLFYTPFITVCKMGFWEVIYMSPALPSLLCIHHQQFSTTAVTAPRHSSAP